MLLSSICAEISTQIVSLIDLYHSGESIPTCVASRYLPVIKVHLSTADIRYEDELPTFVVIESDIWISSKFDQNTSGDPIYFSSPEHVEFAFEAIGISLNPG